MALLSQGPLLLRRSVQGLQPSCTASDMSNFQLHGDIHILTRYLASLLASSLFSGMCFITYPMIALLMLSPSHTMMNGTREYQKLAGCMVMTNVLVYHESILRFCRSNFGYSRYWEGRTNLQTMTARWADFVTEVRLVLISNTLEVFSLSHVKFSEYSACIKPRVSDDE